MDLLLQQALAFLRGHEVSVPVLSRAKYHQRPFGNELPFFLRQFGRANIGDQITVRFSPADTLFKRRCSLTIAIRQITEDAVQTALAGALVKQGFTQKQATTPDPIIFSNGPETLEISSFFRDESASIRLQHA